MSDSAFLRNPAVPIFGAPDGVRPYTPRPSAYAVIRNAAADVAVVRSRFGFLLPGGGIAPGESPQDAVRREALEEAGLVIANLLALGRAIEFIESIEERQCFEKQCHFFAAVAERHDRPTETDVELLWLDPSAAMRALHHESHAWAVSMGQQLPQFATCRHADEPSRSRP